MRCFKVTIEYDGSDFAGFQYQEGQRSVQDEIEKAISRLTGSRLRITGAGRTDSGVHALGQVIGFRCETRIPLEKMAVALNGELPKDIAAIKAEEVDEDFHARFSARYRSYVYLVLNRAHRSALFGRYAWHIASALDVDSMAAGSAQLLGVQDFIAWANETGEVKTTVREVTRCAVRRRGPFVIVSMRANGFLRGMVRNVVGTLVEVGTGRRPAEDIQRVTDSRSRAEAGPSAPPHGLCLTKVEY
jgi:tRNA pseudouridine38-40 synthase